MIQLNCLLADTPQVHSNLMTFCTLLMYSALTYLHCNEFYFVSLLDNYYLYLESFSRLFMIPAAESRGGVVDIALAVHQCGWDLIPDLWSYGPP